MSIVAWPDSLALPVKAYTIKNVVVPEIILYVIDLINDNIPTFLKKLPIADNIITFQYKE